MTRSGVLIQTKPQPSQGSLLVSPELPQSLRPEMLPPAVRPWLWRGSCPQTRLSVCVTSLCQLAVRPWMPSVTNQLQESPSCGCGHLLMGVCSLDVIRAVIGDAWGLQDIWKGVSSTWHLPLGRTVLSCCQ